MKPLNLSLNNIQCERDERVLFERLSGEFVGGTIVQVAGENGAGKTTLLRVLAGLSDNYTGSVSWSGDGSAPWSKMRLHQQLLYLGHKPAVSLTLTAQENLAWYFGINGFSSVPEQCNAKADYEYALERVGLCGYEAVPCQQMSAGQQRRVALARLFISGAPLWILDEPFTAIDVDGVSLLESCIEQHRAKGGLIILTSHQPLQFEALTVIDLARWSVTANV